MTNINRREFVKLAGGFFAAGMMWFPYIAKGAGGKIVIVGGGTGGATAAKYLRLTDPNLEITLIEPSKEYHTCYLSNEVIIGERTLESLTFVYDGLRKRGVNIVHDSVVGIDPVAKKVTTASGAIFNYDRAVISPGIGFNWDAIEGYNEQVAAQIAPHAWKAGPQTLLLQKQLQAMPDGGKVIIVAPPNPFRCPPGPYERASLIAHYLQQHKPKSKVIVLDSKDNFSKKPLFIQAWTKLYGYGTDNALIDLIDGPKGGKVESFDSETMTLQTEIEEFKGDVVCIIPAQKAAKIAVESGLVAGAWCPVNKRTFESTKHAGVYVIGDASDAAKMPKSAYSANCQAKIAAMAIVDSLSGREPGIAAYTNTCYSIAGKDYGFSVAGVYQLSADGKTIDDVKIGKDSEGKDLLAGGSTPIDASPEMLKREVAYAHSWFKNLTQDVFA